MENVESKTTDKEGLLYILKATKISSSNNKKRNIKQMYKNFHFYVQNSWHKYISIIFGGEGSRKKWMQYDHLQLVRTIMIP